jgi:UDP-glucose 4-epimerase
MSTVLVTGVAGFIGSHVARHLIARGDTVIGIDDMSGGFYENLPEGVKLTLDSINSEKVLDGLFLRYEIDYVIHCAAYAAEGLSHFIRKFNYENNLIGSVNLINRSVKNKVKCFVFLSSIAVYGHGLPPFIETDHINPCDPYGIAKAAVEADIRAANSMFGMPFVIFRPFNVFGPNQNISDPYRNVIGIFINQCMSGEPMTIFGDGDQTRAFSYIDDVAPLIANSIRTPSAYGETINIGGETPHTVNALATAVSMYFDESSIVYLPKRNEVRHAYCDTRKAKDIFGERKPTSLFDGLSAMVSWAKSRGPQARTPFGPIEIEENLPPSWAKML